MKRSPLKRLGKKGLAWEKVRRELKVKFQRAGITTCEIRGHGCWYDNGLGFAHAKKRRNLGPGELSVVALACCVCHDRIDVREHRIAVASLRGFVCPPSLDLR